MKTYYTISEIGKLLGLTTDAIRFYEKKGLVHPKVHPENHYRMYHLDNVLELLDIIYYRQLDIPVKDICDMSTSLDPDHVLALLEKKVQETRHKIWYEQQMLKKLTYLKSFMTATEQEHNICEIRPFPDSLILFEGESTDTFFQHEIQEISAEEFVLCAIFRVYEMDTMKPEKTYVTLEAEVLEHLSMEKKGNRMLREGSCLYMRTKMVQGRVPEEALKTMRFYAEENGISLSNQILVHEISFTFYRDKDNYYAEIFIPLAQK